MKAWCCIFATFLSHRTLCATYFPNLRRKLLSYFFRKKFIEIVTWKNLRDSWKPNQTLSINFVLKLRFRENPLWNEKLKPNFAWQSELCRKTLRRKSAVYKKQIRASLDFFLNLNWIIFPKTQSWKLPNCAQKPKTQRK